MMMNPVGWFEIYVSDMNRAREFYQAVFAVSLESFADPDKGGLEMWMFPSEMTNYGSGGALASYEGCKSGGNSTVVYFSCEDCAVEESRVEAAGGKVERAKFSIGDYGFCSHVTDTEGNLIGLHSMQ